MENKFTLNSAIKKRLDSSNKIDFFVLLIFVVFIMVNIFIYLGNVAKLEAKALAELSNENDIVEEKYIQLLNENNLINKYNIINNLKFLDNIDFDEMRFFQNYMEFTYFSSYENEIRNLRKEYKFVHITNIDQNGVKIEVQYE